MINFSKAKFIKSAPTFDLRPDKTLKEVVFVGKSNVGKSSLINALVKNRGLAKTSSKPGYTKLLNYFEIDEKFYLVDAPGYGYTSSGGKLLDSFSKMMETYFSNREEYFANSIQDIENEINQERNNSMKAKNRDFESVKKLLAFINDNRTSPNLTLMKDMGLDEFVNLTNDKRNLILEISFLF